MVMPEKLLLLSLTIVIASFALTATAAADFYVCGDADAGGGVDIDDVVYLINYIFSGGPEPDPYESGDVDVSGEVGMNDVLHLMSYVFTGGPAPCTSTVSDIDGNVYQTVKIGDQWWMMENLKVTHYRNGDPIPNVTEDGPWSGISTGAYCDYDNDPANAEIYGRLYNWFAVDDARNIAPEGWHVPSDAEWKQLEMYLGMSQAEADGTGWRGTDEGGMLKETCITHWNPPNTGATNESGFSALPAGSRYAYGYYRNMGSYAAFWCSTGHHSHAAWFRLLAYDNSQIGLDSHGRVYGMSVRCVRD
jgi:uncharacterized protein (TIGR02145 family)